MSVVIDIRGQTFGRLIVVRREGVCKSGDVKWQCRCVCGGQASASGYALRKGNTQSCGCLQKEVTVKRSTIHGHTTGGSCSRTYNSWGNMLDRCSNPKSKDWANYGGRGIKVCEHWQDFKNFLVDMDERPVNKTLDRKNNEGNYELSNCRWATRSEQARNRRPSHHKRQRCPKGRFA